MDSIQQQKFSSACSVVISHYLLSLWPLPGLFLFGISVTLAFICCSEICSLVISGINVSSHISDHLPCQCRDTFSGFTEFAFRCSALICSVLSSTWEADLAEIAKLPKGHSLLWSPHLLPARFPVEQYGCIGSQLVFTAPAIFPCWLILVMVGSGCLSISMVAPSTNQFSQELLMLRGWKESIGTQRVLCLTLGVILSSSLISSWCNEAELDLYSDCPPNRPIWENGAIGPIFPACAPLTIQTGVQGAVQCHSTVIIRHYIDCVIKNSISQITKIYTFSGLSSSSRCAIFL